MIYYLHMETYEHFKERMLKDKEIRDEYERLGPEYEVAEMIIRKRLESGLSQSDFAKKIGTKQSAISRLESGSYNPSIAFLGKVAKALGMKLVVSFS